MRWPGARRPGGSEPGGSAGFTLIETLIALLLLSLVVGSLASISAEWLPNWKRGLVRAKTSEKIAIALDRLVADLSEAQYVSMSRQKRLPLFQGEEQSVTFVRSAIGPNGSRGLEIVRIAEISDSRGPALVRMRAPFTPRADGDLAIERIAFTDPVVLVRSPLHISFGYAGYDGKWMRNWRLGGILPTAIRFVVRNDNGDRASLISTAVRIHVDTMAPQPDQVTEPQAPATAATTASASPNDTGRTQ
jgi:general secretion pathway protein J